MKIFLLKQKKNRIVETATEKIKLIELIRPLHNQGSAKLRSHKT